MPDLRDSSFHQRRFAVGLVGLLLPAVHVAAETATVTGTLTIREPVTLSPNAFALISITVSARDAYSSSRFWGSFSG